MTINEIENCNKSSWLKSLNTYRYNFLQPAYLRFSLFILLLFTIIVFPLGQAFRTFMPLLCLPLLILLYWKDWSHATLRTIPIRWLLILFSISIGLQVVFSQWFFVSWGAVRPNIFRGFLLVLVGLETVRTERDLRWLIYAFAGVFCYEGLDGIWQAVTGKDYIHGTFIMDGRLTGSLGTYRVGNYMSIIALPSFGIGMLLSKANKKLYVAVLSVILLPGIFLWLGAITRIGYLGLLLGGYILWVCAWTQISWKKLALIFVAVSVLLLIEYFFVSWRSIFNDPRLKIWETALRIGVENFWFGTGSNTFSLAIEKQDGVTFVSELGHPHNIYIQFFIDGGLIGFVCMLTFLLGITYWTWTYIRKGILEEKSKDQGSCYWRLTSFFWGGWVVYLITGLGAHDFYRTWWLGIAGIILGILLGACWNGVQKSTVQA